MDLFEMDKERRQQVLETLNYFLKNDENAVRLTVDVLFIGHLWDDLIDKDKERSDADINRAFTLALGEVPLNPYFAGVYPLLRNAICQWRISNELAGGDEDNRLVAFLLRNALFQVPAYLMFLVGGDEWVMAEGANFWRYFGDGLMLKYQEFLGEKHDA